MNTNAPAVFTPFMPDHIVQREGGPAAVASLAKGLSVVFMQVRRLLGLARAPLRVALVTREFPPETDWGGIGSFYDVFSHALVSAGCEVEVFCQALAAPGSTIDAGRLVHRLRVRRDLTGPEVGDPEGGNSDYGIFVYALANRMFEAVAARHREAPFDIIESHEHLGVGALVNAAMGADVATVVRFLGAYHTLVARSAVTWPVNDWIRVLEKQAIHAAAIRIAPSAFLDRAVQEDFEVGASQHVIPLLNAPAPAPDVSRPRDKVIFFVGRLAMAHKRPDLAVSAFVALADAFPDWRMEIIGADEPLAEGDGTTWSFCRDLVPPPLRDRVVYRGRLDRSEVTARMATGRILLVPSSVEPFGLVAVEAMQAGCVPLVADDTALPEIVGDPDLVFANRDGQALVERLRPLLASESFWHRKQSALLQRYAGHFAPETILQANIEAFSSAVQDHAATAPPPRAGRLRRFLRRGDGFNRFQ